MPWLTRSSRQRSWLFGLWACVALIAATLAGNAARAATGVPRTDRQAFGHALKAMCRKPLVLIGESSHGDGHSDTIKVALIEQLVTHCGFNGVLFEASEYEFVPINRLRRDRRLVSSELIATAVGGLWKFDTEVRPLFDFLADRVNAGRLAVGGVDFQAGQLEQPYSNDTMIHELAARLPAQRAAACEALYHSRTYSGPIPEGMSDADVAVALANCVADIGAALSERPIPDSIAQADDTQEVRNLKAWLSASRGSQSDLITARDAIMAWNTEQFISRQSPGAKVVIWTHNAHAAKSSDFLSDYHGADTMGAALSRRYGNDVYALAITARTGSYRWSRRTNKILPTMPAGSLEDISIGHATADSAFINARSLERLGSRPAAIMFHVYQTSKWFVAFDGVLVLNTEHSPDSLRPD